MERRVSILSSEGCKCLKAILSPFSFTSSICHSLPPTTKDRAQSGIPRLTCAPVITVDSVYNQKKAIRSAVTADLFTWDAHVREVIQEDSVIATLTHAR